MSNDNTKTTPTCLHCALMETAAAWMKEHHGIDAVAADKSVAFAKLTIEQHTMLAASCAMVTGQVIGAAPADHRLAVAITVSHNCGISLREQAAATDAIKN